jgi:NitT/TauT family transport system substrate-binding protein
MRRIAIAALTALLAMPAACGGSSDSPGSSTGGGAGQKVTLLLNWVPYGEHAPFYYGLDKGFYAAEGIKLEIKPGGGSAKTIQAVDQKQAQFGWADTPPLIKGIGTGMKVKSLGVFLQKGPSSIEFFAEKGITKPIDLKGKSVGGTPGDALYATFPAWLKANGMQPSDVKIVNFDPPGKVAALAAGRVDAIMGFFHDQAPTIEAKTGKKVQYLLYADTGLNLLGTGIVASDDTLKNDPELARKFVRATQKSWAEAAKDIPGAVAAMAKLAQNEPAEDILTNQLTLAVPLLGLGKAAAPGVNTEDQWKQTIDLLAQNGDTKASPAATYWDSAYTSKG